MKYVFDVDKLSLVEPSIHRPIFFENSVYQVVITPKGDEELTFYHEHPLLRKAISPVKVGKSYILMGNLHFQNDIGLSTFEVRNENGPLLSVTLEVFPAKLDYKRDYQKLIEEVNDEIYNLSYHFLRKTYLGARINAAGKPSLTEFYRLITVHFDSFIKAIERIERQPHHKLIKNHVKARGDQLQQLDSKGRNHLRKNAHVFVEVNKGVSIRGKQLMPIEGLKMKKELIYDTFENRYVKWMIVRLYHKLEDLYTKLTEKRGWKDTEHDPDLVNNVVQMIKQLRGKEKNHFWKVIGKLDRSVSSLVMQMAPGYRDAFQIYLTVSKGLALHGNSYQMSVKDVATLYEYWTFLKLGQILGRKYEQVSQDIVKVKRDGLFVNLYSTRTAKRVFLHPVTKEKIVLTYQSSGGSLPTTPQKPDTMLSIAKKGKDYSFNYVFDAKYRVDFAIEDSYYSTRYKSPGPLEEDINTMHRYRDSLVVQQKGPYERTSFGAYVLFPFDDMEGYQQHHFYKSIDEVNIGGLPLLPNATELVERFVENPIDKSPEQIHEEGILPRGTLAEWQSTLEEKVLIGVVSNEEQWRQCMRNGTYVLAADRLKAGWLDAAYVALYVSQEAGMENGISYYGKIKDTTVLDSEFHFTVEAWTNLKEVIKPVRYGIAKYAMTTLRTLKEAKEIPELFMKSESEVVIWRMLRRVSDRIKVELDSEYLDRATGVQTFRIKDMEIRFLQEEERVEIIGTNGIATFELEELFKQPTRVFKRICEGIG
ncbi:restriction endonuclease-like protein [Bacillus sp. FJAT-45350]|uniref:restriction endonuclease-like protein n=1 Tax=Bacillus sp. FJAT-45350 TaxID=2011014 RepID=UPI00211D13BD|nr:restriction endonuclease-like protein [Bacillus sp. FJAT-45350]